MRILLLLIGVLMATAAAADDTSNSKGKEIGCHPDYTPAPPGYDFTADVDRWGQKKIRYDFSGEETVGKIHINSLPIFDTTDPKENNALYRWINRIHPPTHPWVFRELILFKEGGPINNHMVDESERILRKQKYASDASIRVVSKCGNTVDMEVITKEVWTLLPEFKLNTTGGKSSTAIGLNDSNFLGTGSLLALSYAHEVDRDRVLLHYQNNNVKGSRIRLITHFEENSDGYVRNLQLALPFYELDATRTWGGQATQSKETEHQYYRGEAISAVDTEREYSQAWFGHSAGLVDGVTNRFVYGFVYDRKRYNVLPGETPTSPMPSNRRLAYPYFSFEQIQNDYGVAYNINQINREEDIHMGRSLNLTFGLSPVNTTRLIFNGYLSDTLTSRNKQLLQGQVNWQGRWNFDHSQVEDLRVTMSMAYHRGQTDSRSLYLGVRLQDTWNRDPERQVILGGSSGLRGYPFYYATGDASYLVTAEQRIFTNYSLFSLFNVGFVGFVDAGRAYSKSAGTPDDGLLTDAGFGIRLVPNKTDKEHVIHFDVAWPLKKLPGASGIQITAEVKKTI